ncbi:MAG: hypothetical protein ABI629_08295 [bacterium]
MSAERHRLRAVLGGLAMTLVLFAAAEIVARLLGIAPQPWPASGEGMGSPGIRVDPLLGPLPEPGWSGRWANAFDVSIDAHGFRASGAPPAAAGSPRVVVLGDSCGFGWGVDTPDTFTAQLAAADDGAPPTVEILNAAYPGHSAVAGLQNLRQRVLPLKPALVVVAFSANNAFRFSVVADADRFHNVTLRALLLRSRLFHIAAAALANRRAATPHPRDRRAIAAIAPHDLKRVAAPSAFAEALTATVDAARAQGAQVLFLLFPRAALVSTAFWEEDAARVARQPNADARALLELSCLQPQASTDPLAAVQNAAPQWQPMYPDDVALRDALQAGARAGVAGDLTAATQRFAAAVASHPTSPLALYDLGVTRLQAGDAGGLEALRSAEQLSCSTFVQYQAAVWQVATAQHVPVVDLTLAFQAAPDAASLYLDPAHPNAAGQRIIAAALRPALAQTLSAGGR